MRRCIMRWSLLTVVLLLACKDETDGTSSTAQSSSSSSVSSGAGASASGGGGAGGGQGGVGGVGGSGGGGGAEITRCNPVTGEPCPIGSPCDIAGMQGNFECYPPPGAVGICGNCAIDYCASRHTCVPSGAEALCGRFCCSDADCGGAACNKSTFAPNLGADVGVCGVLVNGAFQPTCMGIPADPPSMGSCFTIQQ
jgi:hypothetical protein